MGEEAKVAGVDGLRAKALRLGTKSGVFKAVHDPQHRCAEPFAPDPDPSPGQPPSGCRETLQRALQALTRGAMRTDGVSMSLAGSQVDRSKQQVDDMLTPRGRAYTAADLVLIGALCPSLQQAVNDYWRGGGR